MNRLAGHLHDRACALLIRQSSESQKKSNVGSAAHQMDQLQFLEPFGLKQDSVTIYDARGESAARGEKHLTVRRLLRDIREGRIRLLVTAFADRVARNDDDFNTICNALADVQGMLVIGGQIYEPADAGHKLILGFLGGLARFDSEQRIIRSLTAKLALAKRLAHRVAIPTGLVYASPVDSDFCKRMTSEGLPHLLDEEELKRHRTAIQVEGRETFIFPVPDRDVYAAIILTMKWFLDSGSVTEVVEKICSDPAWPRPGLFPAPHPRNFRPDLQVQWERLRGRLDGRDDISPGKIREWVQSPALYGIYRYRIGDALAKRSADGGARDEWDIRVDDAFPSICDPQDFTRLESLLDRPSFNLQSQGEAHHRIPYLRCCTLLPNGEPCGRKIQAVEVPSRRNGQTWRYQSRACTLRGHTATAPPSLDACVMEVVRTTYSASMLLSVLDREGPVHLASRQRLEAVKGSVQKLTLQIGAATDLMIEARGSRNVATERAMSTKLDELNEQLRHLERERSLLEEECEWSVPVAEEERSQLLRLASDLPELLARCDAAQARRLLRLLVDRVELVRLEPGSRLLSVCVVFPGGKRVWRLLAPRQRQKNLVRISIAHGTVGTIGDPTPDRIKELLSACAPVAATWTRLGIPPREIWKPADILAIAAGTPRPRSTVTGQWSPLEEHALANQLSHDDALRLAIGNRLGRVRVAADGSIEIAGVPGPRPKPTPPAESGPPLDLLRPHQPEGEEGEWIPQKEAARRLGMHIQTLKKRIPVVRPGRGHMGSRSAYVWWGPGIRDAAAARGA